MTQNKKGAQTIDSLVGTPMTFGITAISSAKLVS